MSGDEKSGDLVDAIVNWIAARAGVEADEIDHDENLLTGGLVDSIGMMQLIAEFEAELDVRVPPTDFVPENFATVRVMAGYLGGLASKSAAAS